MLTPLPFNLFHPNFKQNFPNPIPPKRTKPSTKNQTVIIWSKNIYIYIYIIIIFPYISIYILDILSFPSSTIPILPPHLPLVSAPVPRCRTAPPRLRPPWQPGCPWRRCRPPRGSPASATRGPMRAWHWSPRGGVPPWELWKITRNDGWWYIPWYIPFYYIYIYISISSCVVIYTIIKLYTDESLL